VTTVGDDSRPPPGRIDHIGSDTVPAMTGRVIDDAMVEPAVRSLLGAIDVGDGGTVEQRALLTAVVATAWGHPELDLDTLEPLDPDGAASAIGRPAARRRVAELLAALELCRHPLTAEQQQLSERYAAALGHTGADLVLARDIVHETGARAVADFARFKDAVRPEWSEPSLVDRYLAPTPEADEELAGRLRALQRLPEGTLGREYVEFYRRQGITLPGEDPTTPAFFVSHDMNHVIAGYGTTAPEEVALSAMLLAMTDDDAHWVLLLAGLAAYETGLAGRIVAKTQVMARPGAPELFAEVLERGAACTDDFSVVDHLSMVELPLADVRERFGVPARRPAA
jgi:hypothetical protein